MERKRQKVKGREKRKERGIRKRTGKKKKEEEGKRGKWEGIRVGGRLAPGAEGDGRRWSLP